MPAFALLGGFCLAVVEPQRDEGGSDGTRTRNLFRDREALWPIELRPQNDNTMLLYHLDFDFGL